MTSEAADEPTGEPMGTDADGSADDRSYGGLLGAFPYAFRRSDSLLFKSYVVLGGLAALLSALLFTFGLIGVIASTTGTRGGVFTFQRAFVVFVGLAVIAPLLAPILSVARRHRRIGSNARSDAKMAASGYLFLATLYLALLASVPPELQSPPLAPTIPIVGLQVPSLLWLPVTLLVNGLYALPAIAGLVPLAVGAAAIYAAHKLTR